MTSQDHFVKRESCPACMTHDAQQLYACRFVDPPISTYLQDFYSVQGGVEFEYLQHAEYALDECKSCGLIYQRFIPNDFLMTKLYEEWIDPKTALQARYRARGVEYYARLSKEIEMVIRSLSKKGSGLDVFDFGMGWGNWCLMAKAYGCTPFGAELSQSRIEHAQELGIKVVSWDDIPNHQFDFINTEQVFEHIATPLDTLRHLSKALKPKGMIKISVPNGRDIKRKLAIFDWTAGKGEKDSLNPVAPLEHINCFSYQSIARMAHIVGLEEVDVRSRSRKNQHLSELTLRDLVYPAYRWLLRAKYGHGAGLTYLFFQSR